jgi:hypothetical protein
MDMTRELWITRLPSAAVGAAAVVWVPPMEV